jgi:hypothetical protein
MFEDAMGTGLVSRTKEAVLKFITRENMEKFKKKEEDSKGAFAWYDMGSLKYFSLYMSFIFQGLGVTLYFEDVPHTLLAVSTERV